MFRVFNPFAASTAMQALSLATLIKRKWKEKRVCMTRRYVKLSTHTLCHCFCSWRKGKAKNHFPGLPAHWQVDQPPKICMHVQYVLPVRLISASITIRSTSPSHFAFGDKNDVKFQVYSAFIVKLLESTEVRGEPSEKYTAKPFRVLLVRRLNQCTCANEIILHASSWWL